MYKTFWKMALNCTLITGFLTASQVMAAVGVDSSDLREAIDPDNIFLTLEELDTFGPRVPGSAEYDAAANYIGKTLLQHGYKVTYQPFDFDLWEENADPEFENLDLGVSYPPYEEIGFATMEYSGSGDVTAAVVKAANFGCDPTDFAAAVFTDAVALIERGECTFIQKAMNAQQAGAAAAIVYNDSERQVAFLGTLGGPGITIPTIGTSNAIGLELIGNTDGVRVFVDAAVTTVQAYNILAETPGGRDDRVVVVGAHLDGVDGTTAINDNGSGTAAILEIAKQFSALGIQPLNKIRFAFWSAEESGLIGSEYYVNNLSDREFKDIALNLNFDMLGSNNYVRFVYDGDGSATPDAGPNGSGNIEQVFADYFNSVGLPFEETAFDGRSDYGPFIEAGIPAGGLFTGADETKTAEQQEIFGGTAGELLDPNYHTPEDNLSNLNQQVLGEMTDAAAHAVLTFAMTTSSVNGTSKASPSAKGKLTYKGPNAQR